MRLNIKVFPAIGALLLLGWAFVPPAVIKQVTPIQPTVLASNFNVTGLQGAFTLSNNRLIPISLNNPSNPSAPIPITGLADGETLVDIDFRPMNGLMYGLARNAGGQVRLYCISHRTGTATPLTATAQGLVAADGTTPIPVTGTVGIDFNPAVDRLRIVTSAGLNFRINPNTGLLIDGNPGAPGVQPDANIGGATTRVDSTLYTNNNGLAAVTTQYTLDAGSRRLFIQNPPNSGTQVNPLPVTVSGSPLNFTQVGGFDVADGVNTATAGAPVASGTAFAVLQVGGVNGLYAIELATGAARLVGLVGDGTTPVQGLAIQMRPVSGEFAVALNQNGTRLVQISLGALATNEVTVTGVAANERLVGVDFRPATGQFYGLGIDVFAARGTLYLVDPKTGACSPMAPSAIAYVQADGATQVPLPPGGYGMDFNPVVDRLRVTTATGLNFRINPNDGQPLDGNPNAPGVQMDGAINGLPAGLTGVAATAYTNAFAGTTVTTQYTIDAAGRALYIQSPPNSGTQIFVANITFNGAPLPIDTVNGFDISPNVRAQTSNAPVRGGRGILFTGAGGVSQIFSVDLVTGRAVQLAEVSSGNVTGLSGGSLAGRLVTDVTKIGVFSAAATVFTRNTNTSGTADAAFAYGLPGDIPIVGDWDGDGVDTIGVFRPATAQFFLRNSNTAGFADFAFNYGAPGDLPVAGDWTGKGFDSVGVFRNGVFFLKDNNTAGFADRAVSFGQASDLPVVGDWNGDGKTSVGVFRDGTFLLRNNNTTGPADTIFAFGQAGDRPVAGDWTGKGFDSVGVFRNGQFLLRNANASGTPDITITFGSAGDRPLVGNWNGEFR
ncbi:MAG: DUF4394 domain-containing protein [Chloracidobacterium sp.]|nr:DUF4394 domain-containing protein [Chloracidobacterium sp.]MDW8218757.1 DUF4394 domain-containing protein [Acidobacteriota bacterium]